MIEEPVRLVTIEVSLLWLLLGSLLISTALTFACWGGYLVLWVANKSTYEPTPDTLSLAVFSVAVQVIIMIVLATAL